MENNEKIRLTGYIDNSGKIAYIKNHINKYNLLKNMFVGETNKITSVKIFFDFWISVLVFGSGINDYFQYNFFKRSYKDREKFIVGRKWLKIINKCNGSTKIDLFDDKLKFNYKFKDYLRRDWLDVDKSNFDDFNNFVKKHKTFFLKKNVGSGGNGISKYYSKDIEDSSGFYDNLKGENYILEESIIQLKSLKEFNPSSVNTIRVVTIRNNEKIYIMDCVLRMGNGDRSTDNFHQHGLAMKVDPKTGEVVTEAIDKSNNRYVEHPKSHKKLLGYKIPYWSNVIDTVNKAALEIENVRYVGWDVAILENGQASIIEGNCSADPDITQMPDQIGKWDKYKEVIDKL
ncbi:sugar-transfer associated ATP-grasp domain-containing protein [Anaerococcus porci]|uniref:sugar-transfer associated ATP-grasp domain-containing protein n=1 Tax=Anaerococcus porci TaxID=2652269 RepID=UPI002A74FC3D|nr:sugar-transfer associated ATP-grasp domain-containing protein [Anaerococcus porci]MDY3006753.1 sugar-transfer associated ATP-grasp domain-containing protein [Anaerococcus porci]